MGVQKPELHAKGQQIYLSQFHIDRHGHGGGHLSRVIVTNALSTLTDPCQIGDLSVDLFIKFISGRKKTICLEVQQIPRNAILNKSDFKNQSNLSTLH